MIEIRYNGRLVVTTGQAAEALRITPGGLRARLARWRKEAAESEDPAVKPIEPATYLDPRTPLYYPEDLGIEGEA